MKSDLKGPKKQETKKQKYPYLGIFQRHDRDLPSKPNAGLVVLFTEPGTGTLVHKVCSSFPIGQHDVTWAEEDFEPLLGKITLEND